MFLSFRSRRDRAAMRPKGEVGGLLTLTFDGPPEVVL
jgi:hypothetical protein